MNIGDKVRLLYGKEEGIIRKISPGGRIMVEIEDGFVIPVSKSELVSISSTETGYFGASNEPGKKETRPQAPAPTGRGLCLAFAPTNDQNISIHLVNDSNQAYLAHVSEVLGGNHRTLYAGTLEPGQYPKFDNRILAQMDEWPAFLLRFIPIQRQLEKAIPPFERKVKVKPSQFSRRPDKDPLMGKSVYLFPMEYNAQELDIHKLNAELDQLSPRAELSQPQRPPRSIDLHIEQLHPSPDDLDNPAKMRVQLEAFEQALNQAIASGMDEITFIHGLGNGILRKEIHRRLSQLTNIKYFQDTHKNQWGYGATLVRIS